MNIASHPSSHLPKNRDQLPKADLRRPITAWRALVWAYRDECVRAATNTSEAGRYAETGFAASRYSTGEAGGGGLINGLLEAHVDAHAIDQLVANWFDEWPLWRQGVAVYAEKAELPPHPDALPRFRIVGPEINAKGNIRVIYKSYGRKDEGFLVPLQTEGFDEREIQRHCEFHALFLGLLDVMAGLKLKKWRIAGLGY